MSEIAYPVTVYGSTAIHDAGHRSIAEAKCLAYSGRAAAEERARRIAACLNACRDISTEELESGRLTDLLRASEMSLAQTRRAWRESIGLPPEPAHSGSAAREG